MKPLHSENPVDPSPSVPRHPALNRAGHKLRALDALRRPHASTLPLPATAPLVYKEQGPEYWHALIICVNYVDREHADERLDHPHEDGIRIRDLLIRLGWSEKNITMLSDVVLPPNPADPGSQPTAYTKPTRTNIIKALQVLLLPALEGEHAGKSHKFVFFYAGHGAQEPDAKHEEDDDLNECIVPSDCNFDIKPVQVKIKGNQPDKTASIVHLIPGDPGWINDDLLCDLLCRRLPENCMLRACFDMCHSGTPLDLPFTYTGSSVPRRHRWRFDWVDAYLHPDERKRHNVIHRSKPRLQGDPSSHSRPAQSGATPHLQRAGCLPIVFKKATRILIRGVALTVVNTSKRTIVGARAIVAGMTASPPMTNRRGRPPRAAPPPAIVLAVQPPLAEVQLAEVQSDSPTTYLVIVPVPDLLSPGCNTSDTTNLTPTSTRTDYETVSSNSEALETASSVSSTSRRPRSESGPLDFDRFHRKQSSKKPIVGDITCLGAASDDGDAPDRRSLAKFLVRLHDRFEDPKHYQLILWVTRCAAKKQVPQFSSSRDMTDCWHAPILV